uniref:Toxin_TOLIP domain-containing protein n=1 Tax=Parastrongyloides trichosuri TaxID=131310 RepID=A0A0N4ZPR4_PARTI
MSQSTSKLLPLFLHFIIVFGFKENRYGKLGINDLIEYNINNDYNGNDSKSNNEVMTSGLECYYCTYSMQNQIKIPQLQKNHMDYCLSKYKLKEDVRLRTPCAIHENMCMSVVKFINNRIVDIERDCVNSCSQQCFENGYGITVKRCIRCCNTSFCNDFSISEMDSIEIKLFKGNKTNLCYRNITLIGLKEIIFLLILMINLM